MREASYPTHFKFPSLTITSFSCDSDSRSEENKEAEVELYKADALSPVFDWKDEAYSLQEIANILLRDHPKERLCVAPPENVAHNVSLLVNNAVMKNQDDIKCDDMVAWAHTGTPKRSIMVTYTKIGQIERILQSTDPDCSTQMLKPLSSRECITSTTPAVT